MPLIPEEMDRVMVTTTARVRGARTRRGPDREDANGPIAVVLVERADDAATALADLDRRGRTIFVDVERKQPADLMGLARDHCPMAHLRPCEPNAATVAAVGATIRALRGDGGSVGVLGLGNIGFRVALQQATYGTTVRAWGRDEAKTRALIDALNHVLPAHSPRPVRWWDDEPVDVLASCVAADHAVGPDWCDRLSPGALVLDIGIDTFHPGFVATALAAGHDVTRVDHRAAVAASDPANAAFFAAIRGRARIAGVSVVAGGILGARGEVIVDAAQSPTHVMGIASGTGGMLAEADWTNAEQEAIDAVAAQLRADQAGR